MSMCPNFGQFRSGWFTSESALSSQACDHELGHEPLMSMCPNFGKCSCSCFTSEGVRTAMYGVHPPM